jgi:hypothetical protein
MKLAYSRKLSPQKLGEIEQSPKYTSCLGKLYLFFLSSFRTLMKKDELWVSIDNWGFMRPTKGVPTEPLERVDVRVNVAVPPGVETADKPEWRTKSRWFVF